MEEKHWDLPYFKNKIIPSSSDEDNPHLLSSDSEEEKLFRTSLADIILDVGNEFYNKEKRLKFYSEEKKSLSRLQRYPSQLEDTDSKSSVFSRSSVGRRDSIDARRISAKKRKTTAKTSQALSVSPSPEKNIESENTIITRIEENTFLGLKERYSHWKKPAKPHRRLPDGTLQVLTGKEIFHILPISIPVDVQKKLKCESGVDILLEQPWGIILKTDIQNLDPSDSPFADYLHELQEYTEEEILIGRTDEANTQEFLVALTLHGRGVLLEELKSKHAKYISHIIKSKNLPARPWASYGSEVEIEATQVVNNRPFISYDCTLKKEANEKRSQLEFKYAEYYSEITIDQNRSMDMVKGIVMDKSFQASPGFRDILIQTAPEIPVNSSTQFSIEMRVEENEEILNNMELDSELMSEKLTCLLHKIDPHLTYNEDFDLYQDDYEILGRAGEHLSVQPLVPYEYLSTMLTFLGTEKKGIASSSWHPNQPGVIAVAYAHVNITMIADLEGNSDEEDIPESDSDDEGLYADVSTRSPFDNVIEKVWQSQIEDLALKQDKEQDKSLYRLSTTSLEFMKYARDMRLFQMVQAKKQFLNQQDFPDLNEEENFKYTLFEGTKKKYKNQKEIDVNTVLSRKSTFLDRDYLFSDSFKWKLKGAESLNPIYMMMKEHKKLPKKYIRTFLFREIWSGDEWNFGSDLELKSIDINRDFREAGIFALGMPLIPKHKIFLPGFSNEENAEPAEQNPWKALEGSNRLLAGTSSSDTESDDLNRDLIEEVPRCNVKLVTAKFERSKGSFASNKSLEREVTETTAERNVKPKIAHVSDSYLSNISWRFNTETQDFLLSEIKEIATCENKQLFQNDIEVVSEGSDFNYWEKDDDFDELDKIHLQHYAVIWTIGDILRPMHRLSCPFELTCVSFCPYDGNFIAGGTLTGQVVLWEVTEWSPNNIQDIKITDPNDEEGFRHLRKVMCWFKRLSKVKSIPVTSLSSKKTSHTDRVIDITWLPPNIRVTPEERKFYTVSDDENGPTMQFMSTSADGTLMYWDIKGEPKPFLKAPFTVYSLHRGDNFPVPKALEKTLPTYGELYLRWEPVLKVNLSIPLSCVTAIRYHITCISNSEADYVYEVSMKAAGDKQAYNLYRCCSNENPALKPEALIGTVDGSVILFTWHDASEEQVAKIPPEGLTGKVIRTFNYIHDGPVVRIARHPKDSNIFLTAGGHVFALWTIDRTEPLKWKKYPDHLVTFVGWTTFQASTFRVGLSSGTFEVWDLLKDGNKAQISLSVGEGSICDMTVPRLPEPRGLVGVVDQKGLLKFYQVPKEYQQENKIDDDIFFAKINVEKKRKKTMSELAEQHKKEMLKAKEEKAGGKKVDLDESVSAHSLPNEGEMAEVKVKEVVGCKKFKEEMYKWYLRRRGRPAGWLDEAEKQWYQQEEKHMIQTILENKKISLKTLELALVPLKEKEKHEAQLAVKKEEIAYMADELFRKAIQEMQVTRDEVYKFEPLSDKGESKDLVEAMKRINVYFGEHYMKEELKLEKMIQSHKIPDSLSFGDILLRNQKVRDFWNDRRRYLNKDQRWLRELVKEELDKQGLKFSYWINHEDSYKTKKYKRRLEMIDRLKKVYGDDYDPFWDLEGSEKELPKKEVAQRLSNVKEILEKLMVILQGMDPSVKDLREKIRKASENDIKNIDIELLRKMVKYYIVFAKEGGIRLSSRTHKAFMSIIDDSVKDETKVEIKIPEGSFFRKYLKDKQLPWVKPKRTEDIFRTSLFKFKYGDLYPQPSNEKLAEPEILCADLVKQVKQPEAAQDQEDGSAEGELSEPEEAKGTRESRAASERKEVAEEQGEVVEEESPEVGERSTEVQAEVEEDTQEEEVAKEEESQLPISEVVPDSSDTASYKGSLVRFKSGRVEKDDQPSGSDAHGAGEEKAEDGDDTDAGQEVVEDLDLSEELKRQLDVQTLYDIIEEKKAKGEEILNIDDLSSYESIESVDSISSMADSPEQSICSEEWQPVRADYLKETEKDLKEYFEGQPPRYEPPRRRPYFRAPHEDEETEEWVSEEKSTTEEFGKSYLGGKTEKQDKPPE